MEDSPATSALRKVQAIASARALGTSLATTDMIIDDSCSASRAGGSPVRPVLDITVLDCGARASIFMREKLDPITLVIVHGCAGAALA